MTYSDIVSAGRYGAKVQSFSETNPRAILWDIMDKQPGLSKERYVEIFRERIDNDPDVIDTVIRAWFANCYLSLMHEKQAVEIRATRTTTAPIPKPDMSEKVASYVTQARVEMAKVVDAETKRRLKAMFAIVLPNRKKLGDCTGDEAAPFCRDMADICRIAGSRVIKSVDLTEYVP